jgi:hypothetical protein
VPEQRDRAPVGKQRGQLADDAIDRDIDGHVGLLEEPLVPPWQGDWVYLHVSDAEAVPGVEHTGASASVRQAEQER